MPDYQGNSKKGKEVSINKESDIPPKNIERIVSTEVIIQKKGIGRKFRDLFIEADFRTVIRYIAADVLLPAARNTILDASTKGIERMLYGESAIRRRNFGSGPRITYNNPISRSYQDSPLRDSPHRYAPSPSQEPRTLRYSRNEFILSSREEAELVLERMNDIIDTYGIVSVADLNELVGIATNPIDNKWGWNNLGNVPIRQIREGYLIEFPQAEPIQ